MFNIRGKGLYRICIYVKYVYIYIICIRCINYIPIHIYIYKSCIYICIYILFRQVTYVYIYINIKNVYSSIICIFRICIYI